MKKYLSQDGVGLPPRAPSRAGTQPQKIGLFVEVIDGWVRADVTLKGSVIHERLVAEYGFTGNYQRVKMYLESARGRIAAALAQREENPLRGLHRRFEVVPGAQAQVDCGEESDLLRARRRGARLLVSHDPVVLARPVHLLHHLDVHRDMLRLPPQGVRALRRGARLGRLRPDQDRRRGHVAPGVAVPLHRAAAFAAHYGFEIDVLAAYRPTGKRRVERQVAIVRDHVMSGRSFDSIAELDAAWQAWLPIRRAQTHRTHGEVIAARAQVDRTALTALPAAPYLVADRHLRVVGKDCLVSFEASLYSVPARKAALRHEAWLGLLDT